MIVRARRFHGLGPPLAKDIIALMAVWILCLAARMAAWRTGLSPDPSVLVHHWQHLPLVRLAADLSGSLADLRSQPPLWNLIIGLGAKTCTADVICTTEVLHRLNVALTGAMLAALYATARVLGAGRRLSVAAAAFAGLSPSVFLYETYVFYPHLTAVLASVAVLGAAILAVRGTFAGHALLVSGICGLSLTVTLWHPLAVAVAAALALPFVRYRRVSAGMLAVLMVAVAGMPAARNLAGSGLFASGTWMGLNLIQTAPNVTDDVRTLCSFQRVLAAGGLGSGPMEGEILNRPIVADLSKVCGGLAMAAIRDDPMAWVGGVAARLAQSHVLMAYHETFVPRGFEHIPQVAPPHRTIRADGSVDVLSLVLLGAGFLSFPIILGASACVAVTRRGEPGGAFAAMLLGLIIWHTAVSHAANGAEQNRMRYTIEPAYLGLAVMLIGRRRWHVAGRAGHAPGPAPEVLRLSPAGRLVTTAA